MRSILVTTALLLALGPANAGPGFNYPSPPIIRIPVPTPTAVSRSADIQETGVLGTRVAKLSDIEFMVGTDKVYAIENVRVTIHTGLGPSAITVRYETNANYGAGSNDATWYLNLWMDGANVAIGPMKYAAYCQHPRTRAYQYIFALPEGLAKGASRVSSPVLTNASHAC